MSRILLTGMSGTGKSTLIGELAARGYTAVDADSDEWSEWVPYIPRPDVPESTEPDREWVWRASRVRELLATEDAGPLFVSGCAKNMSVANPRRNLPSHRTGTAADLQNSYARAQRQRIDDGRQSRR